MKLEAVEPQLLQSNSSSPGAVAKLEAAQPAVTTSLLFDPYVTRHALAEPAFPLDSDETTSAAAFPQAAAVLVGQSHHDHLLDALSVAKRTGATIDGSATSCAIASSGGLARWQCVASRP